MFLKEFGNSKGMFQKVFHRITSCFLDVEGKEVMRKGTKEFSLAASSAYSKKTDEDKKALKECCSESQENLTSKEIKKNGCKIFKNINIQVGNWLDVGGE